jgi:hypothetical protein
MAFQYSEAEWFEYFIETATEEWNRRSQLRYRCYPGRLFTLAFLSAEAIKKQKYLEVQISKVQILRRNNDIQLSTLQAINARLQRIEQLTVNDIVDEIIQLAKKA